jgi:hypothetical protein
LRFDTIISSLVFKSAPVCTALAVLSSTIFYL